MREKRAKKIGGGDLAGFCDTQFMPRVGDIIQRRIFHWKWELNLHISDFFCIFAAGKKKTDNGGCRGKGQESDVPVT